MFGGEEELVRLRFKDHLIGVVMDRFGKDVTIFRKEGGYFEIYTRVVLSSQFYGWIFALGDGARILSPETAVRGMMEQIRQARKCYETEE